MIISPKLMVLVGIPVFVYGIVKGDMLLVALGPAFSAIGGFLWWRGEGDDD